MNYYYYNERRSQCKTKGEEMALSKWWSSLSYSEQQKYQREHEKKYAEEQQRIKEECAAWHAKRREEKEKHLEEHCKRMYVNNRRANSLNTGEVVALYIAVMLVGSIFKGNWLIWIIATYILYRYFSYEARREAEWENGGKEKYFERLKNINKGDKNHE